MVRGENTGVHVATFFLYADITETADVDLNKRYIERNIILLARVINTII